MVLSDPVVMVGAARTPIGGFQGDFKDVSAPVLGSAAIRAALLRSGVTADQVEEVVFGCVLPAGVGQAPARQAGLGAGMPFSAGATTVSKMCGSGMKAVMLAYDAIAAGSADILIAGGMESMTSAPYLLNRTRSGYRMGHGQVFDHLFLDGLEDAYEKGRLMGAFAEECAEAYQFTREAQDDYARASLSRAQTAIADGSFTAEIVDVAANGGRTERLVRHDEQRRRRAQRRLQRSSPLSAPMAP